MSEHTYYTPTWRQNGDRQPDLGDGTLTGWHTEDGELRIELTIGSDTVLGDGPLEFGPPGSAQSVGALATLTHAAQTHTGHAWLPGDEPGTRILIATTPAPPRHPDHDMLWSPGNPATLEAGDTIVIDGKWRPAPPDCPDCHIPAGQRHTPGCTVALCRLCGLPETTCPHAGQRPRGMPLWHGQLPGEAEAAEFGYADRDALLAAARAGDLEWDAKRERWEPPPPPEPELDIPNYGFDVERVQPRQGETPRYAVTLPHGKGVRLVWAADKTKATADMQRFVIQAQAALERLRALP